MKSVFCLFLAYSFTCVILAQYEIEESGAGTTGSYSVDNAVKDGNLVVVAKFYSNKEVAFGPLGSMTYSSEVEVTQTLLGKSAQRMKASYKVWAKSEKGTDGKFHTSRDELSEVPTEGVELIAIGKRYDDDGDFHTKGEFYIRRYVYFTPQNLERVNDMIAKYHAEKKTGTGEAAKLEMPRATPASVASSPDEKPSPANSPPLVQPLVPKKPPQAQPAPTLSEEPSSTIPWSIIVVLIVAATGLLWLLLKRRS